MSLSAADFVAVSVAERLRLHADLLESPVGLMDEAEVCDLVRSNEKMVRTLQGVGVEAAARLTELGGLSAEDVYSTAGKQSTAEARRVQRRADLATVLPSLTRSFMAGTVATANVDAVASARHRLRHNPDWQTAFDDRDSSITRKAVRMAPKRFSTWLRDFTDRLCDDGETDTRTEHEKNTFRSWTNSDGRWQGRVDLDAVTGEMVQNAIDAEARSLAKDAGEGGVHHGEHLDAQALVGLVGSGNHGKGRPSINIITDLETLQHGVWDGTIKHTANGTNLPLSDLRRYLCDSWITHTLLNQTGRALAVGRSYRTATDAQRAALRVMYPTCAMCEVGFDRCEIHHIIEWEHGGLTDLNNLIPLCGTHHERVHHHGVRIELDNDRNLTIYHPNGDRWKQTPLPSAAPAWARTHHRKRKHHAPQRT